MRQIFTLLFTLAFASVFAQPTITYATAGVMEGTVINYRTGTQNIPEPGDGGANINWDFTMIDEGTPYVQTFIDTTGGTYSQYFTNANLMVNTDGDESFFKSDFYGYSFAGSASTDLIMVYDDIEDYLHYPFAFGDNFEDSFHSTYSTSGFDFEMTGNVSVEADGWGTLQMPDGDINNVLRVHMIESSTSTSSVGSVDISLDMYLWYKPGFPGPLMDILSVSVNGNPVQNSYTYRDLGTGVEDASSHQAVLAYPNPSKDLLQLSGITEKSEVILISNHGIVVKVFQSVNTTTGLDISDIAPGVYNVMVRTGEKSSVTQIIVE